MWGWNDVICCLWDLLTNYSTPGALELGSSTVCTYSVAPACIAVSGCLNVTCPAAAFLNREDVGTSDDMSSGTDNSDGDDESSLDDDQNGEYELQEVQSECNASAASCCANLSHLLWC